MSRLHHDTPERVILSAAEGIGAQRLHDLQGAVWDISAVGRAAGVVDTQPTAPSYDFQPDPQAVSADLDPITAAQVATEQALSGADIRSEQFVPMDVNTQGLN